MARRMEAETTEEQLQTAQQRNFEMLIMLKKYQGALSEALSTLETGRAFQHVQETHKNQNQAYALAVERDTAQGRLCRMEAVGNSESGGSYGNHDHHGKGREKEKDKLTVAVHHNRDKINGNWWESSDANEKSAGNNKWESGRVSNGMQQAGNLQTSGKLNVGLPNKRNQCDGMNREHGRQWTSRNIREEKVSQAEWMAMQRLSDGARLQHENVKLKVKLRKQVDRERRLRAEHVQVKRGLLLLMSDEKKQMDERLKSIDELKCKIAAIEHLRKATSLTVEQEMIDSLREGLEQRANEEERLKWEIGVLKEKLRVTPKEEKLRKELLKVKDENSSLKLQLKMCHEDTAEVYRDLMDYRSKEMLMSDRDDQFDGQRMQFSNRATRATNQCNREEFGVAVQTEGARASLKVTNVDAQEKSDLNQGNFEKLGETELMTRGVERQYFACTVDGRSNEDAVLAGTDEPDEGDLKRKYRKPIDEALPLKFGGERESVTLIDKKIDAEDAVLTNGNQESPKMFEMKMSEADHWTQKVIVQMFAEAGIAVESLETEKIKILFEENTEWPLLLEQRQFNDDKLSEDVPEAWKSTDEVGSTEFLKGTEELRCPSEEYDNCESRALPHYYNECHEKIEEVGPEKFESMQNLMKSLVEVKSVCPENRNADAQNGIKESHIDDLAGITECNADKLMNAGKDMIDNQVSSKKSNAEVRVGSEESNAVELSGLEKGKADYLKCQIEGKAAKMSHSEEDTRDEVDCSNESKEEVTCLMKEIATAIKDKAGPRKTPEEGKADDMGGPKEALADERLNLETVQCRPDRELYPEAIQQRPNGEVPEKDRFEPDEAYASPSTDEDDDVVMIIEELNRADGGLYQEVIPCKLDKGHAHSKVHEKNKVNTDEAHASLTTNEYDDVVMTNNASNETEGLPKEFETEKCIRNTGDEETGSETGCSNDSSEAGSDSGTVMTSGSESGDSKDGADKGCSSKKKEKKKLHKKNQKRNKKIRQKESTVGTSARPDDDVDVGREMTLDAGQDENDFKCLTSPCRQLKEIEGDNQKEREQAIKVRNEAFDALEPWIREAIWNGLEEDLKNELICCRISGRTIDLQFRNRLKGEELMQWNLVKDLTVTLKGLSRDARLKEVNEYEMIFNAGGHPSRFEDYRMRLGMFYPIELKLAKMERTGDRLWFLAPESGGVLESGDSLAKVAHYFNSQQVVNDTLSCTGCRGELHESKRS